MLLLLVLLVVMRILAVGVFLLPNGDIRYMYGYWGWVEYVLARSKETLYYIKIDDAIFASMFTYDHNENVLQVFFENWRPSTNTVASFIGDLSISLWDLRTIGGLPLHGSFYDEVIPLAKESTFYQLIEGVIDEVPLCDWTMFWFRGPRIYVEPSEKLSNNRTNVDES
ncbi:hypothetical protein HAX54_052297 [Datura stramonium]|uniref:Uncharacterized protein n=1 Tax=Datura stramonium TaxID=4076 RepID=A0ABS8WNF0_DATST|nr:hypothetical protein [Datura stramonium]